MKKEIIENTIDLHVHIGPDIMPRKYDLASLLKTEKGKIAGLAVKRHFLPACGFDYGQPDLILIESVTLNNSVGGFNADAVFASAAMTKNPLIVWFPTVHAEKFLKSQEYEVPLEWFGNQTDYVPRKAKDVKGMNIFDSDGGTKRDVIAVLEAIKETGSILATGHLTWQESAELIKTAKEIGIKKIIVTHPVCPGMIMPLEVQIEMAKLGAYIEECYTKYSIHKIPISEIAKQIRAIGVNQFILSSDVGQVFSSSPSEALSEFGDLLMKEGITEKELEIMMVENPRKIVQK